MDKEGFSWVRLLAGIATYIVIAAWVVAVMFATRLYGGTGAVIVGFGPIFVAVLLAFAWGVPGFGSPIYSIPPSPPFPPIPPDDKDNPLN